jgi:hypothetical protein
MMPWCRCARVAPFASKWQCQCDAIPGSRSRQRPIAGLFSDGHRKATMTFALASCDDPTQLEENCILDGSMFFLIKLAPR